MQKVPQEGQWRMDQSDTRLVRFLCLALAFGLAPPAGAQDPCTITPYDATSENGLGAAPGFVVEYCTEIVVPEVCRDRGSFFINTGVLELTQTNGDTTMPFTAQVRRLSRGSSEENSRPGPIIAGPSAEEAQDVSGFPNATPFSWAYYRAPGSLATLGPPWEAALCARLDGDSTVGQFLATDESAGTPRNRCWIADSLELPEEDCTTGAPNLRAVRSGLKVSPHGGVADGSQAVPPVTTSSTGILRMGPNQPGGSNFWIEVIHDVAFPTAANIHEARAGEIGPVVIPLGDPTSPIFVPSVNLDFGLEDVLKDEGLYLNITTAANPNGEIRGQIGNAGDRIFSDGFELGDLSAWQ